MTSPFLPLDRKVIAREAAKMFLEIGAVLFYKDEPFKFTSGWASPVYTDSRKIISFPRLRSTLMDFATATIVREIGYEKLTHIAGGETAGIPFAAWIADRMMLPMQYIRKKPKGFGRNAQIEGEMAPGARVLLVEDLASEGTSKLNFVRALRQAGGRCEHAFVVFNYGIYPKSIASLEAEGVRLHALATWWDVLRVAEALGSFTPERYAAVRAYLENPDAWSATRSSDTLPST
jgi:orotate phosphoribosyltransferase